jgi:hypothetical protein
MENKTVINTNFSNYELVVLDMGYNLIVCGIVGINKIIYIHKFPPALNTTIKPQIVEQKTDYYEHKFNRNLRRETVLNFWQSKDLYQVNGDWKGGEWGSSNLATSSKDWFSNIFIGDKLSIKNVIDGIIPYNKILSKPFNPYDEIIVGSENYACTSNITQNNTNQTYSCYICDVPMPQSAIDVLFVWENSLSNRYVKILKRGMPNPNVDMPNLLMPGAGEHREPGNKICFKTDALRAINEEIGISSETISKSYLIHVGTFNKEKRDPRYWSFSVQQDDSIITFGPERYSETNVYVLYIKTETENEPEEIEYEDKIEVGKKYWIGLENPILTNKKLWMIPEHSFYFEHSKIILDLFCTLEEEEKNSHKINV